MRRPVHFEIHASDPERASAFYVGVFGWTFQRWGDNPYWLINTGEGPGINGGLVPRRGPEPTADAAVSAFPVTMEVPDLVATVNSVTQHGGTVTLPRHAIAGMGWLAYCKDTEGNLFGLLQNDPSAA